jgi:hypothetical protein
MIRPGSKHVVTITHKPVVLCVKFVNILLCIKNCFVDGNPINIFIITALKVYSVSFSYNLTHKECVSPYVCTIDISILEVDLSNVDSNIV